MKQNAQANNVVLSSVCDVWSKRMDEAKAFIGDHCTAHARYEDLLEQKDLDAVVISTHDPNHAKPTQDAAQAGKHVYLEKPMTLRLGDALKLYRFAAGRKERLQVGTQYVTYKKYHDAREMIAAGDIGHPTFSQTSYCRNSRDGEWLFLNVYSPGFTVAITGPWAEGYL